VNPVRTLFFQTRNGGGRVFSFVATSSLLATRWRLGAGAVFLFCAQLLWCLLYDMKDIQKQ